MKGSSERFRIALAVLLGLAVLGGGVAWFLHTHHRVERVIPLPPSGEAGYNPLYALRQTLLADGVRAESRQRLDLAARMPGVNDTLLLLNDPNVMSPAEVARVLDWVEGGGHLLLRTPASPADEKQDNAPILEALGIVPADHESQCEPMQVEGQQHHVEFCDGRRFLFHQAGFRQVEPELSWGDLRAGYVYARLAYGKGHVDVLADFNFLDNGRIEAGLASGGLRDAPHRALARQVLAPNYRQGTMHLVYAAQMPSLLRTILREGWPVWLPLALALLAWLGRRSQRFGPLHPAPAAERRSLLEHVRASGEHLFRYNKRALLYASVRNAFLARLRRRDPVAAALRGEAQVEAIATRLALSPELVRGALQAPGSQDKPAFRNRISTLIQMRNRL